MVNVVSFSCDNLATLMPAFCQGKIEHKVRKCRVEGLILRNMAERERDAGRLYESGYTIK